MVAPIAAEEIIIPLAPVNFVIASLSIQCVAAGLPGDAVGDVRSDDNVVCLGSSADTTLGDFGVAESTPT